MKVIQEKLLPGGGKRITVEVERGEKVVGVREDGHYKLGHPVDDVVSGHVIAESVQVSWCSASQRWAE